MPRGGEGLVEGVVGPRGAEVLLERGVGGVPHDPELFQLGGVGVPPSVLTPVQVDVLS